MEQISLSLLAYKELNWIKVAAFLQRYVKKLDNFLTYFYNISSYGWQICTYRIFTILLNLIVQAQG